jgi:acyl-CoA synthetase (AMP-forming)/AMP-acid ligase II
VLAETVREAAARFKDRALFVAEDGAVTTYAQFDELSDRAARWFLHQGVREGEVVACRLPSEVPFVVAYAALAKIGAITAGINPKLSPFEQDRLEQLIQPRLTLSDDRHVTATETPQPVRGQDTPEAGLPVLSPDPERTVALVFTSGTSGTPKAAEFRVRQLRAIRDLDLGERREEWDGGAPMFVSTQMPHVGFMTKLPWYLQTGSTLHLMPRWSASRVLTLADRTRMPVIGGVAPQIALLLRSPALSGLAFDSLKMLVVGGAASPPALVGAAIGRFGASYSIRYSTESGGVGLENTISPAVWAASDPATAQELAESVGRPRPGVNAAVIREDGSACEIDEVGELCLSSPAIMSGYWNDPEATARAIVDGWLRTGDLARVRSDGRFQLAGRRSEMYIRGGYNVFPAEVEDVLCAHPDVDEVAVVGVADELMGEVGVAAIVPRPGAEPPSLDQLCGWAAEHLAAYKLPAHLVVYQRMPLTPMQKIDKRTIAASVLTHPQEAP